MSKNVFGSDFISKFKYVNMFCKLSPQSQLLKLRKHLIIAMWISLQQLTAILLTCEVIKLLWYYAWLSYVWDYRRI